MQTNSSDTRRVDTTPATDITPSMLWSAFRRCWVWALPAGLTIGTALAYAIFATYVPVFEAVHLLEANRDFVVFKGVMPDGRDSLATTERKLIETDLVIDPVLVEGEVTRILDADTIENAKLLLLENTTVSSSGTQTMLAISYRDGSPVIAAEICNLIANSYLTQRERLDSNRVTNLEAWIAPSIDFWKSEVEAHEDHVRELNKITLGYDPDVRVEGVENDLSILVSLRSQLKKLVVDEAFMEAQVAMGDAMGDTVEDQDSGTAGLASLPEPTESEILAAIARDRDVQKERLLLSEKEAIVRRLEAQGLTNVKKGVYERLQAEAKELQTSTSATEKRVRTKVLAAMRKNAEEEAVQQRLQSQLQVIEETQKLRAASQRELAELKARRAIVEQEYSQEKLRLEKQGGDSADLMFAEEDRETAFAILTQLNQRLAAIRTEQRRGSGVQTLAEATPPLKPVAAVPIKKMVFAGLMGLVLPFAVMLFFEYRSHRIFDPNSLEKQSIAPVIGEVSRLPARSSAKRRQRIFEESIDTLRANLMLSGETKDARTITIASSMSGEGKSSVSSQLAISIAKASGKTVLLIDADMRSPDQHDIFGLDMGEGLSKVLSGESTASEAIDKSMGDLVHVLPAGYMHISPHRLLSGTAVDDLLDECLNHYRYVIVDTAPVLAAGETLAIASATDATLLCVMRDVSRTDALVRTHRRLEAAGANVVGTVFSGVPAKQYTYRYGDYRYMPKLETPVST